MQLLQLAGSIKNPAFRDEAEWRFIFRSGEGVKFRVTPLGPVPYIEFEIPGERGVTALREVMVGPTLDKDRAKYALEAYLKSLGRTDVAVTCSEVPLR